MTQQPVGESAPEPAPSYAQPQDPWAGFETGVAAVPTDPIPGRDAIPQSGDVWSAETLQHGGPYGYVPQQQGNRVGLYILVIILVLLLGGGGGYSAWYVVTHRAASTPQAQNTTTSHPPSVSTSPTQPSIVPSEVKKGDCLFNRGSDSQPDMITVACSTPNSYTVLDIFSGESIPKAPDHTFTRDVTYKALCKSPPANSWYAWDDSDDTKDYFYCMKKN
jgi:hypothetical protein